jgi:hypothetical protein
MVRILVEFSTSVTPVQYMQILIYVRFEVLTAVHIKITILRYMTPCNLVDKYRTFCSHLQNMKRKQRVHPNGWCLFFTRLYIVISEKLSNLDISSAWKENFEFFFNYNSSSTVFPCINHIYFPMYTSLYPVRCISNDRSADSPEQNYVWALTVLIRFQSIRLLI